MDLKGVMNRIGAQFFGMLREVFQQRMSTSPDHAVFGNTDAVVKRFWKRSGNADVDRFQPLFHH